MSQCDFKHLLKVIATNLREVRQEQGLRQVDLAEQVGIDYRNYQKIESGTCDLKVSTLFRLADFYKVPVETLVKYDPSKHDGEDVCCRQKVRVRRKTAAEEEMPATAESET